MKKIMVVVLILIINTQLNAQYQKSSSNFSANYLTSMQDELSRDDITESLSIYSTKLTALDSIRTDDFKHIQIQHQKMKTNKSTAIITTIFAGVTFLAGLGQKTKVRDSGNVLADALSRSSDKLIGNILIGSSVAFGVTSIPFYFKALKYKRQRNKLIALQKEDKAVILERLKK